MRTTAAVLLLVALSSLACMNRKGVDPSQPTAGDPPTSPTEKRDTGSPPPAEDAETKDTAE